MSHEATKLTATELIARLETREISSRELVEASFDQIDRHETTIGAFLSLERENALIQADKIDQRRKAGDGVGRLGGVPIALKDLLCIKDRPTTCGSQILKSFHPPYNATVVDRLLAEDAIIIGKTNLDEFAMGSSTEHSSFKLTRNPWNADRTPGGSSGGSAAAVAASMTPWSIGTDTGGSIRQPAAFCGVSGLKPTYGRVSRFGLIAYASSLDQIGPIAKSVEDLALLLEVISGDDPRDSTCSPKESPSVLGSLQDSLKGSRIGRIQQHELDGLTEEIRDAMDEACQKFEAAGAEIHDISLPHLGYGVSTYYLIASCEASSNLARYDGIHYGHRSAEASSLDEVYSASRSEGLGTEVQRRIMLGAYALSEGYFDAYYLKSLKVRRLIREDYQKAFESVDLLIGPTTPTTAFKIGEMSEDPLTMYLQDIYTVSANLAGIPAMSLPGGFDADGLPIGIQLQASSFDEARLLNAGWHFQQQTDWHQRSPQ